MITTLISLGYYAYFESNRGATIGKQLMKLKVVGPDGVSNPTMEQAVRRNIFHGVRPRVDRAVRRIRSSVGSRSWSP